MHGARLLWKFSGQISKQVPVSFFQDGRMAGVRGCSDNKTFWT
jgi:hypothetical protein